ncbi:MAG TPA: DUF2283 domain-containing protein [Tepidisphaeraceae bacterium]|nr:DUF2283 domain-containing protein [Tepidisphaeraceae bacterium]
MNNAAAAAPPPLRDQEADVLYMSFRKPQNATKTTEVDDDILIRKNGRTIVGLTIMNASTRKG